MKKIFLLAPAFLLLLKLTNAQNGELDQSFGTHGIVKTEFTDTTHYNSTAVQPDGKIVVAGYTWNGRNYDFLIVRYNTDGSLDNTFSGDGIHKTGFGSANSYANSVAVQKDGKIVVVGSSNNRFALTRYNTDGSLDNTFSGDGKQIDNLHGFATSAVLQRDGKIVVAGVINGAFAVARYTAAGSLDNSFSGDGAQTTVFDNRFSHSEYATSVAIQSDGKIVAVGGAGNQFAIARFNPDGSLDNSFSNDGKEIIKAGEVSGSASSVTIQKDDKIVVAGDISDEETNAGFAIYRLNTDGSFDNTFHAQKDYSFNFIYAIAIQNDGKIVAGGSFSKYIPGDYITGENFTLIRFNSNGGLDSSFNGDGIQRTEISGADDKGIRQIVIKDDKLYAVGNSYFSAHTAIVAAYLLENSNNAPTVSISVPNNILLYSAPARIKINAIANDKNGTISKVEFYNGNKLLHTEDVFPYGYLLIDVPQGYYDITAKAHDNDGFSSTSNAIHISVVYNQSPVVKITSPVTFYVAPATIPLVAQPKDPDGQISKVRFYVYSFNNHTTSLLKTEYYYPYTYNWKNVQPGRYVITAEATDNKGYHGYDDTFIDVGSSSSKPMISSRPSFENSPTDLKGAVSLKLSPNPARNTLNIYTNGLQQGKPLTLSVVSAAGVVQKTMQSNTSNKVVQLDISSLISGVYTIKVVSGDKVAYKQFMKL